eukprot:6214430-Pleurochrysis_carterae.AAC.1
MREHVTDVERRLAVQVGRGKKPTARSCLIPESRVCASRPFQTTTAVLSSRLSAMLLIAVMLRDDVMTPPAQPRIGGNIFNLYEGTRYSLPMRAAATAMDDVAVRVSAVAYAISEAGAALLLRRGQNGEHEVCTAENECGGDQTWAAAAELLCSSLPLPMIAAATESSDPAGVTAMLTARISLGVGVYTVSTDSSKLVFVPVRHQAVPDGVDFDWVSAAQLVAPSPAGPRTAAAPLLERRSALLLLSHTGRIALVKLISKTERAQIAAPQEEQAVDPTIPRKLQQGLFLGEMATVRNEDLLRMLGISHVLIVHDQDTDLENPSHVGKVAEQVAAAIEVGARLRASTWVLEVAHDAATNGNAKSLLEEACLWILQGMDEGCVLVAGDLCKLRASTVWVSSALLAATAALPEKKGSRHVPKAFARCRG